MNLQRIASVAASECMRQQVGLRQLIGLLKTYTVVATWPRSKKLDSFDIVLLGNMIEPTNINWRQTSVIFANGGGSCSADVINSAMFNWINAVNDSHGVHSVDYDALIKHLLWIHPFRDGNGRLAWILRTWLLQQCDDPKPLPDYEWN